MLKNSCCISMGSVLKHGNFSCFLTCRAFGGYWVVKVRAMYISDVGPVSQVESLRTVQPGVFWRGSLRKVFQYYLRLVKSTSINVFTLFFSFRAQSFNRFPARLEFRSRGVPNPNEKDNGRTMGGTIQDGIHPNWVQWCFFPSNME